MAMASPKDKGKATAAASRRLQDYPTGSKAYPIPIFVEQCVDYIEKHEGSKTSGIYSTPANERKVQKFLSNLGGFPEKDISGDDVMAVAGALKQFVRGLGEPLIPVSLRARLRAARPPASSAANVGDLTQVYIDLCRDYVLNYRTLAFIMHHLKRVAEVQEKEKPETKMDAEKLAEAWAWSLVGVLDPFTAMKFAPQIEETIKQVETLLPGRLGYLFKLEEYRTGDKGVPIFIQQCVEYIEDHVMKAYRVYLNVATGGQKSGEQLADQMKDLQLADVDFRDCIGDEYAVPEALKKFIRELQEPLFPQQKLTDKKKLKDGNLQELKDLFLFRNTEAKNDRLYDRTLGYLFKHLKRVTEHEKENLMGPTDLGRVWVSTLYAEQDDEEYKKETAPIVLAKAIKQADQLFPNQ